MSALVGTVVGGANGFAKRVYVGTMRSVRSIARRTGLLAMLDRRAARSRWGLWARSLLAIHDLDDLRRLNVPWWTFAAIGDVDRHLAAQPAASVFEWGSGASTHWLAERCAQLVSIEHDPAWAERVDVDLAGHVRLVTVPPGVLDGVADPVLSSKPGFGALDFSSYVAAIDEHGGPFDLIVIDGRAREACLAAALPRLAADGLIVFDDTERRRYRRAIAAFPSLAVRWTFGLTPAVPYPAGTALLRRRV